MRATRNPPDTRRPANLDYEMWTGPAPMRPYNALVHPRSWRAFMEYGNGIVGDMCVHMLDMTRWMLDLGWPKSVASTGGILVDKAAKANISDTQTATFDFANCRSSGASHLGRSARSEISLGATFYGDKGTLKASVIGYDFTPQSGSEKPIHRDCVRNSNSIPEDKTEKDLEKHVRAGHPRAHERFSACIANRGQPVADIEEGYISTASCIMANLSMGLGRSVRWDAQKGAIVGDDEANKMLKRPYRAPWVHPEVG